MHFFSERNTNKGVRLICWWQTRHNSSTVHEETSKHLGKTGQPISFWRLC